MAWMYDLTGRKCTSVGPMSWLEVSGLLGTCTRDRIYDLGRKEEACKSRAQGNASVSWSPGSGLQGTCTSVGSVNFLSGKGTCTREITADRTLYFDTLSRTHSVLPSRRRKAYARDIFDIFSTWSTPCGMSQLPSVESGMQVCLIIAEASLRRCTHPHSDHRRHRDAS